MSNAIRKDVEELTQKELEAANKKFPLFSSNHEAYAVLLEEVEEAEDEIKEIKGCKWNIWQETKANYKLDADCAQLKEHAISLACEAIQVAAMAQKAIDSEERRNGNE